MKEPLPRWKPLRLKDWDYSTRGLYFLTVCAKDHQPLFGRVVGGGVLDAPRVALTEAGAAIERRISVINAHYRHVQIEQYVIMPNHLHLLVLVSGPSRTPAPTNNRANEVIPALISTLKRFVNKDCGEDLWQTRYYDHVVRDDRDLHRIQTYIDQNPAKWAEDRYYCVED